MPNFFPSSGITCIDGIFTNGRQGGYPGGNDGALVMCIPGNDYNAIRAYDSCASTSTIHFFGPTWAGGVGNLGNSSGAINLDGSCGATLGPWNGPIMIINKATCSVGINTGTTPPVTHNGRGLVVNGRGTDTRGIMELWDSGASGGKSVLQQVGGDTYLGQLAKGTGAGNLHLLTGGGGSSATISMTLLCAGNIGIGTTSPAAALHVVCGQNMDNLGTIRYENNSTSTGSTTNAQLLGVSKYGCAQYMVWEDKGMRIGMRSIGAVALGAGELYFTTCNDTTQMVIKNTGNVGIGTTTPESALHVAGLLAVSPTGVGVHMGLDVGGYAGIQLTGGTSQGAYIDFSCTGTDAPGRIIYYITSNSMDFTVCGASRMRIACNGSVGIGTITPSYRLHVNGTFYAAGSSQDYKEGICQYNTDSCLFMCLKPKTYQYKDEWKHLGKELKSETQIGLIAEEVAESHPELAILVNEENEKVVRNVDYEKLSIILLSEVQKLRQEVDDLKNKQ